MMHSIYDILAGFAGGVVACVLFQSVVKRAFEDVLMEYERAKARVELVKATAVEVANVAVKGKQ